MTGGFFFHDANSVLQTLIAVSLLLALVLVSRKAVARHFGAGVAYALWAIPVARLFLPPLTVPVSVMSFLRWPSANTPTPQDTLPLSPEVHAGEAGNLAFVVAPPAPAALPPATLSGVVSEQAGTPELSWDMVSELAVPALFIVWAGGAIFCFGLSLWRHYGFMQTVKREAVSVSPRLNMIAGAVGAQVGLKRLPVIASSLISSGPLVTGLLRPVVLLPAWFENDYDETQQRAALAHELAHVRRGDLWALQIAEICVALLWFNPLAYAARRAFRTDQEAACDADVIRSGAASPHAYGATLIKAVRSASQERLPAAAGLPLTHALKERLSRMTHPTPSRSRRLIGASAAVLLGAGALACTSSVTANAGEPEQDLTVTGLTVEDGGIYIDGEKVKDRQIVILGEPFGDYELSDAEQAEIDHLSALMAEEGAKIGDLAAQMSLEAVAFALTPEDEAELQSIMLEIKDLPVIDSDGIRMAFDFYSDMSDEEREALEAEWEARGEEWADSFDERMEAWGEEFGARMEAWGERIEARAAAHEAELEPRIEMLSAEAEAKMEEHAARLEAIIESRFGEDFETTIELKTDALDEMVDECKDANLADGETRIISRNLEAGKDMKIVCVKGDKDTLRSSKVMTIVTTSSSLTPEEKDSFRDQVGDDSELEGSDN